MCSLTFPVILINLLLANVKSEFRSKAASNYIKGQQNIKKDLLEEKERNISLPKRLIKPLDDLIDNLVAIETMKECSNDNKEKELQLKTHPVFPQWQDSGPCKENLDLWVSCFGLVCLKEVWPYCQLSPFE